MFDLCMNITQNQAMDNNFLRNIKNQGIISISIFSCFFEALDTETLKDRIKYIRDMDFDIQTSHPRFSNYNDENSPSAQDSFIRHKYIEYLKWVMERYSWAGISVIPLHTGGSTTKSAPPDTVDNLNDTLCKLEQTIKDTRVKIAVENTFYRVPSGYIGALPKADSDKAFCYDIPERLIESVKQFDPDLIGLCYDTGHAHFSPHKDKTYEIMKDRILLYHLQDVPGQPFHDMHLPPGYGTINWETLGNSIIQSNSKGVLFIESQPWNGGDLKNLQRETNALLSGSVKTVEYQGRKAYLCCNNCGHIMLNESPYCMCSK